MTKIFIGADHRGFEFKNQIIEFLQGKGIEVIDKGAFVHDPEDDYPDFGIAVGTEVANNSDSKGVILCGSSIGVCVSANKVKTIFASNPRSVTEAIEDKKHHNSNVLALSSDNETIEDMYQIIDAWLDTEFEGGRHQRRLDKISVYESNH